MWLTCIYLRFFTQVSTKKCFVLTCKSGKPGSKSINCRYFTPPTNLQQFRKWETILVQGDQELKPDSTICECHFNPKYFYRKALGKDGKFIWGLKEGAIPRLNNTGVPKYDHHRPTLSSTLRPAGVLGGVSCVAAKSTTSQLKPKGECRFNYIVNKELTYNLVND